MKEITTKFISLIDEEGENGELHLFDYCSDYGIEIEGSTIDKVENDGFGSVTFYFNENTGDSCDISEFSVASLNNFYNEICGAIEDDRVFEEEAV